ncbi:MAG: sigma-70 family RNA polymerase sigma factor [Gemmatimonadaceae bacterium]|nr:sigma-70 family RNA polymerase sigma factor [Gemmatimonadaceae bacterium]
MSQPSQQVTPGLSPARVDDAALLQKIAEGDVAALGTLFDRMARPVYSLVMQLLRSHDQAEDVVESTFWQVWQEAGQLGEISDPRSWLLTTGRRRAIEHIRSRRRKREELLQDKREFGELVSAGSDEVTASKQRQELVQDMGALEPGERQALELAYFRGLSQNDIVDLIGEPTATVKARMRSSLERLRRPELEEGSAE